MSDRDDMRALDLGITMAVATLVEALGMHAENQQRASLGNSMAYTMESFEDLLNRNYCHWNGARGRWER